MLRNIKYSARHTLQRMVSAIDGAPALYYGTEADDPEKTWKIDNINSDGAASGHLVILFDVGATTGDAIRELHFSAGFDTLRIEISGAWTTTTGSIR